MIGDIKVTKPALQALAKGPKFAISPQFSREKLQHTVQTEVAALAYAMRWQSAYSLPAQNKQSTSTAVTEQTLPACPFHSDRKEPPRDNPMIEKKIQNIQKDIQRIIERCDVHVNSNLPLTEQTAIKELSKQENITITRSDKGGEMVVMKASHLKELCLEHLGDTTTYEKLKKDPSDALRLKVNKTLKGILTKHDFSTTFINNLQTPPTARTQHFYGLPKTYKTNLKIRPIVSACGGIFDRLGWFLQQLLKPLLSHVKAHLNSTTDLLARFNAIEESKLSGTIPISFDVVSLYTNINVEEAIETSLEYALKHKLNLYGLRTDELFELLHLILDNNILRKRKHAFQTNP